MPWIIEDGKPVKIDVGISVPEVTVTREFDELVCPECGKEYKTQTGLDNHLDSKH